MAQTSQIDVVIRGRDELSPDLSKLESRIIRVVGAISASLAALRISTAPIRAAADFEEALANVSKTTDFTRGELAKTKGSIDQLGTALLDMSLRTNISALDLAKIAAIAGEQGLGRFGVEGVVAFTDAVQRMASVLDITAEEAGDNIGKIVNIFKVPLKEVENAVSIFNEVSNNSTANGKDLLDVIRRIGDAAGSLKLDQVAALAATGLDFGQSAEVVGTSFTKVFSSMFEDADKFAAILNRAGVGFAGSADDFIGLLKADGLSTIKLVLDGLRKLKPQDQQAQIVKLFGGGRIGALINKLIQDVNNTVLTKNFESATEGKSGLSAIKEQSVVLNTLNKQAEILRNTLFKLGTDSANALLEPLTRYTRELSAALQTPGVRTFVDTAVAAIGGLIGFFATAIKVVAGFNINWDNFIRVLQVFISLKLAETIIGIVGKFSLFGVTLKSIAIGATAATVATGKLSTASAGALATQGTLSGSIVKNWALTALGIKEAVALQNTYNASIDRQKVAQGELQAAQLAFKNKEQQKFQAQSSVTALDPRIATASANASAQRQALRDAEARQAAAVVQQQKVLAEKIAAAETLKQQRLIQIQTKYNADRAVIDATGTRKGLASLQAEKANQIALTQASYDRQIRSTQAYYARQAAIDNAELQKQTNAQRLALIQRNGTLDGLNTRKNTRANNASNLAAEAGTAGAAVSGATSKVFALTTATNAAKTAFNSLGIAMRTIASGLLGLARIAAGAFFWVSILFTIADMLGIIDKLSPLFQRLTDAIGLTSKANRDQAIAVEEAKKKWVAQTEAIEAQTKALRENLDVRGELDTQKVDKIVQQAARSDSPQQRETATKQLGSILAASDPNQTKKIGEEERKNIEDLIRIQEQALIEGRNRLLQRQEDLNDALRVSARQPNNPALKGPVEFLKKDIEALEATQVKARDQMDAYSARLQGVADTANRTGAAFQAIAPLIQSMFTDETVRVVNAYLIPVVKAQTEIERLTELYKTQIAAAQSGGDAAKKTAEETNAQVKDQRVALDSLKLSMDTFIKTLLSMPGISKAAKDALTALPGSTFFTLAQAEAEALINALKIKTAKGFTGKNAQVPDGKATGGLAAPAKTGGGEESEARKLARAQLAFKKVVAENELKLKEGINKQLAAADQKLYDEGLISISSFYKEKQRIEIANIDAEIKRKNSDKAAAEFELTKPKLKGSEKVRLETDLERTKGDLKVLEQRRLEIPVDIKFNIEQAQQQFAQSAKQLTATLFTDGFLPQNVDQIFAANFDALLGAQQKFVDELRANGRGDLAEALLASLNVKAFESSIQPITNAMERVYTKLGQDQQRIDIARATGSITAQEAERAYADVVQQTIPKIEEQIRLYQKQLDVLKLTEGVTQDVMDRQIAQIDALRLKLQQLFLETDKVARDLNKSITDSLSDALQRIGIDKFKDVVKDFLRSVVGSVQKLFADKIAEEIIRGIGSGGAGGVGGFFQKVLQKPDGNGPLGTAVDPIYVRNFDALAGTASTLGNVVNNAGNTSTGASSQVQGGNPITGLFNAVFPGLGGIISGIGGLFGVGTTPGSSGGFTGKADGSPINPFYVKNVDGTLIPDPRKTPLGNVTKTADPNIGPPDPNAPGGITGMLNSFITQIDDVLFKLTDTLLSVFEGLGSSLSDLFSGLFSGGGAGGGGGIGSLVGLFASFFHEGGDVANGGRQRLVNPAVFKNAQKFHDGVNKVSGLKSNEVPAILEKAETVLTERQNQSIDTALTAGASGKEVSIRSVLVTDPKFVPDAMSSAQGEQVLLNFVSRNRSTLRQMIGR